MNPAYLPEKYDKSVSSKHDHEKQCGIFEREAPANHEVLENRKGQAEEKCEKNRQSELQQIFQQEIVLAIKAIESRRHLDHKPAEYGHDENGDAERLKCVASKCGG